MIKVVYTYHTPTQYLPELLQKFVQSAQPEFDSRPNNVKIEMWQRRFNPPQIPQDLLETSDITEVVLDIYYASMADYLQRNYFEKQNLKWQHIWFNTTNRHTEVRVQVLETLPTFANVS